MDMNDTKTKYIVAINKGSSSLKCALFDSETLEKICEWKIDKIGMEGTCVSEHEVLKGTSSQKSLQNEDVDMYIARAIQERVTGGVLVALGNRVVHGGSKYFLPTQVDNNLIAELEAIIAFAPRHLPPQISLIKTFITFFPEVKQYACFDTAFFHELPHVAQIIALPHTYEAEGIRRYGFHGLSYEFLMQNLEEVLHEPVNSQKIVLAHLGSGASLAAVHNGKPVETTMGLTPTSGVPMSTRSGDLDPGLFEYFTKVRNFTPEQFSHMVNFESGLLGVSGSTADMEALLAQAKAGDARAEIAVAYFCYHIRKQIGALSAVMGGIDALVFTGGMGDKAPEIRKRICANLEYLGIRINESTNATNSLCISGSDSRVILYVIPTDEETMIAHHVQDCV